MLLRSFKSGNTELTKGDLMVWSQWCAYSASSVQYDLDMWGIYELGDDAKNTVHYGSGKIKTECKTIWTKKIAPMG